LACGWVCTSLPGGESCGRVSSLEGVVVGGLSTGRRGGVTGGATLDESLLVTPPTYGFLAAFSGTALRQF
ncbi:hypothetical protein TIFTF001_053322, partial [Ficus carica]